jgi:hypothetical protein
VKSDPERQVIVELGTKIDDPAELDMSGAGLHIPDVENATDIAKLERTLLPYRDLVGCRTLVMDNSSVVAQEDRSKVLALFQWAREIGMELIAEAIPQQEDDDIDLGFAGEGAYAAVARTEFIDVRDPDLAWRFPRARCFAWFESDKNPFTTREEWLAYMRRYAHAGYGLWTIPTLQGTPVFLDDYVFETASAFQIRGASCPVAMSVCSSVSNTVGHIWPGQAMNIPPSPWPIQPVSFPVSGPVSFPVSGPVVPPLP